MVDKNSSGEDVGTAGLARSLLQLAGATAGAVV